MENLPTWITLATVPLLCFIYLFFFKKFRYVAFIVGLLVYLFTIGALRRYKSLQGTLISQQTCDTQNANDVANFNQCGFMLKDTIDVAIKATKWADCLKDVAKGNIKNKLGRQEECNYMAELYSNGIVEWNQALQEYERKTNTN